MVRQYERPDMVEETAKQVRILGAFMSARVNLQKWGDPIENLLEPLPEAVWIGMCAFMGFPDDTPQPELVKSPYLVSLVAPSWAIMRYGGRVRRGR